MRMLLRGLEQDTMYLVQLRTKHGENTSLWSKMFELPTTRDEVPPNPVTNLVGLMNEGNLSLSWEPPTHNEDGSEFDDLKDYEVTIGPVPEDIWWPLQVFYVESNRADFTKEMNTASFGTYRASLTITVRVRDIMGNLSQPVTIEKTKPRPKPVDNLVWGSSGKDFVGSWSAPTQNVDNSPFTDADGYEIRVIHNATDVRTFNIPSTTYSLSFEENKKLFGGVFGTAKSPLTLEVRARDSVGQLSTPVALEAGNAAPKAVHIINATDDPADTDRHPKEVNDGIVIEWEPNVEDDDIVSYEVWVANSPTADGVLQGSAGAGATTYLHTTFAYSQDHYLYITAKDEFSRGAPSNRVGPFRPVSPFTLDTEPPPVPTAASFVVDQSATNLRPNTKPAGVVLKWDKVTGAEGYHIRYALASEPAATRNWNYHDVIENVGLTEIAPLQEVTSYVFEIRSYDKFVNTSAWRGPVTGTSSSSIVPLTEIASDVQVITGGVLRSANYNETNGTGWRLMHSGLDIQSGTVNARVIRAGELRSNINITDSSKGVVGQPLWSLNLDGNMSINDAQVRGKIVVGSSSGTNGSVNIASWNYGGSGSQWAIKGDGTFDMYASGTSSGRLQINGSGIYGYDTSGNQRIELTNNGIFRFATTNGGLVLDNNGLFLYNGGSPVVSLNSSGSASFSGSIYAAGGTIGGWNISSSGTGLSAGSISLRPDLSGIYAGNTGIRGNFGIWSGASDYSTSAPFNVDTNGYLRSTSGEIGGFYINGTSGLYAGSATSRVQMQPYAGFWAGATSQGSAPFRVYSDGTMYALYANITGSVRATVFNTSGYKGYGIEMGSTGTSDPVDEIRFFSSGGTSSIRNASSFSGGVTLSTASGQTYHFTPYNGFYTTASIQANGLNVNGSDITGANFIRSSQNSNTRIGLSSAGVDIFNSSASSYGWHFNNLDASHGSLRYGTSGSSLKWLSGGGIQVWNFTESAYASLRAVIDNVSSVKYKSDIVAYDEPVLDKLQRTQIVKYKPLLAKNYDGSPVYGDYEVVGALLEEMPPEMSPDPDNTDSYSVGAAIGMLWKAIQELDERTRTTPTPKRKTMAKKR